MKNLGKRRKLARQVRADLALYLIYLEPSQYSEAKAKAILDITIEDMLALSKLDGESDD